MRVFDDTMRSDFAERGGGGSTKAAYLLVGVVLTLLIAVVPLVLVLGQEPDAEAPSIQVAEGVSLRAGDVLSFRPGQSDAEIDTVASQLTPDFAERYRTLVAEELAPTARAEQLVTRADIVDVAVIDATETRFVLLVFADIVTTRAGAVEPAVGGRFRVTAERIDGEWLINEVESV